MAYQDEVLADSPIGYWRMGTGSSPLADSAVSPHTLATTGTVTTNYLLNQASLLASDASDKCMKFVGSAYAEASYNSAFDLADTITLECWVRLAVASNGNYALISHEPGYRLDFLSGQVRFIAWSAASTTDLIATTGTARNDDAAHHIVATKSGTTVKIYIDGVKVAEDTAFGVGAVYNASNPFTVGALSSDHTLRLVNCFVDEVAIYGTELSAERILTHYNRGAGIIVAHEMALSPDMQAADSADWSYIATLNLSSSAAISDAMDTYRRILMNFDVAAEIAADIGVGQKLGMSLLDGAELSSALSSSKLANMALTAAAQVHPSLAMNGVLGMALSNVIKAAVTIQAGDTTYTGWIINPNLAASAGIEGMPFNSFASRRGKHYGIGPGGVYELGGDDDDGAAINSFIGLPKQTFGASGKKRVPHAYIGAAGEKLVLRVVTEDATYTYTADNATTGMGEQRITLGKGLRANYWQFELVNQDGADFDIDTIKFMPIVLERRRGE